MDAPEGMPDGAVPFRFDILCLEGYETSDARMLVAGGGSFRDLPMPLQATDESAHGGLPGGAVSAGVIATCERYSVSGYGDGVFAYRGTGWYGADETGQRFARLAAEGRIDGVSVDLAVTQWEIEVTEEDEDGWPTAFRELYVEWEIMGATQVPFPAFADARIIVDAADLPDAEAEPVAAAAAPDRTRTEPATMVATRMARTAAGAMVAAGAVPDDAPPREWFDDPQLDGPTPLTVSDPDELGRRRVFGHIAAWHTRHTGYPDRPVYAPRSRTGYALFHTGDLVTAEGEHLPVGRITVGGGHASTRPGVGVQAALEHYDDVATTAAYARAGEDAHGIWVAGAVAPGLPELQVRQLMAHPPSGDWRPHGGSSELIIAHCVNAPGFPVERAYVASGEPAALVAAGYRAMMVAARRRPEQATALAVRAAVDEALAPFLPLVREQAAQQHLARIAKARARRPSG